MICGDCLCVSGKDNKRQRIPPMAGSVELASLFKSLRLSNSTNYNVYLVGSRLWGTDSTGSDWDLLVVGDLPPGQLTSLHKSQYDVKLLDRHEFRARVKEGSFIEVVCALMRKEDMLQVAFDLGDVVVNPDAMKTYLGARQILAQRQPTTRLEDPETHSTCHSSLPFPRCCSAWGTSHSYHRRRPKHDTFSGRAVRQGMDAARLERSACGHRGCEAISWPEVRVKLCIPYTLSSRDRPTQFPKRQCSSAYECASSLWASIKVEDHLLVSCEDIRRAWGYFKWTRTVVLTYLFWFAVWTCGHVARWISETT